MEQGVGSRLEFDFLFLVVAARVRLGTQVEICVGKYIWKDAVNSVVAIWSDCRFFVAVPPATPKSLKAVPRQPRTVCNRARRGTECQASRTISRWGPIKHENGYSHTKIYPCS